MQGWMSFFSQASKIDEPDKEWRRIHNRCLEEQFGLGSFFTQELLEDLGMASAQAGYWVFPFLLC